MREIKFRAWYENDNEKSMFFVGDDFGTKHNFDCCIYAMEGQPVTLLQYTGLKDKNGTGLIELYEGDIISSDGKLIGNIYEDDKRKTDLVIPALGTRAWEAAYKEAVARGFDYSE